MKITGAHALGDRLEALYIGRKLPEGTELPLRNPWERTPEVVAQASRIAEHAWMGNDRVEVEAEIALASHLAAEVLGRIQSDTAALNRLVEAIEEAEREKDKEYADR